MTIILRIKSNMTLTEKSTLKLFTAKQIFCQRGNQTITGEQLLLIKYAIDFFHVSCFEL